MFPGILSWPPGSSTPHPEREARQSSPHPASLGASEEQPLPGWEPKTPFLVGRHLQDAAILLLALVWLRAVAASFLL